MSKELYMSSMVSPACVADDAIGIPKPGSGPTDSVPQILFYLAGIGLNFGILVSSMTTKYRDLIVLFTSVVLLWMYSTAIVNIDGFVGLESIPTDNGQL